MRIDYLGLEAFAAIAEHGSFQRAADALHLSQTALSHRLRKIEADLGAPLLIRSSREMSLTRAGQDLLPDARRLLKERGDSYAAVRALFDEPYDLIVPAAHPLADQETVSRADLAGVVMARFSTRHKNRQLVDDALAKSRDRIDWRDVVPNATMAMVLVAAGAALTILQRCAAEYAPQGIVLKPFSDIRMARIVGIVTRRGVLLSALAQQLMSLVEERLGAERQPAAGLSHAPPPG